MGWNSLGVLCGVAYPAFAAFLPLSPETEMRSPWLRAGHEHVRSRRHGLALRAGRDANDQMRHYAGREVIRAWLAKDLLAPSMAPRVAANGVARRVCRPT